MRQPSVTPFEGTNQVMVVGQLDRGCENHHAIKGKAWLRTPEGLEFLLVPGSDVEGIENLINQRLAVFGVITEEEGRSNLLVLGYRVLEKADVAEGPAKTEKPFRWKAA